jgi:hypothetical protein
MKTAATQSDIQAAQPQRKVYVPYTVLPAPVQRNISPSGGQGVSVEYERQYIPADNRSFNEYTDGTGRFDIRQYATRIYVPKERFIYASNKT